MISFEEFLNYPLSTALLGLCNPDRSVHKVKKNKLAQILMSNSNKENTHASKENKVYVVDLNDADTSGDGRACI